MMRPLGLVLSAALLIAAGPPEDGGFPIPPIPPAHPPADVAAPTPNADAHGPVTYASTDPRLAIEFYRAKRYDMSRGFAPGSRFQTSEDRKPIQTPGISITVPIQ
jgi:hypothetical protein